MASTAFSADVDISQFGFTGRMRKRHGISALATGTVELDTGLNIVQGITCLCVGDTNGESVVFLMREDSPTTTGTVTIDGTLVKEATATADAGSEQFYWEATGE